MNSKVYLFLTIISIFNKILLIVVGCFLLYLTIAIPSFPVPFDNNFYNIINHSNNKELIEFSKQLVHWIKISNDSIHSLSTIMTLVMILLFLLLFVNYLLNRTVIKHLKRYRLNKQDNKKDINN